MKRLYISIAILLFLISSSVAAPMVLTFNTAVPGSTDNTVTLPLQGTANVTVDWGDGSAIENIFGGGFKSHTYSAAGTYTVSVEGTVSVFGNGNNPYPNAIKLISMSSFGDLGLTGIPGAFNGTTNLVSVPAALPSTVTNLSYLFYNSKFNGDISGWDVSNVIYMGAMFNNASAFNQNIGGWNVSKVTDMSLMFLNATNFNQDLSSWNVGNVTNMNGMFSGASVFNQNISGWDVSKVADMGSMFAGAKVFNQDIGAWNVGNVTNMSSMFQLANAFDQNIGGWNVSKVTNMRGMFNGAKNFNQNLNNWNVGNVTNMQIMFLEATNFNGDVSSWDVSKVTTMGEMFRLTPVFNSNISNWNVGNVTSMAAMFMDAKAFNRNIGNWNVSKATNLGGMFAGASVFNQNIGGWDVSNVTNMGDLFSRATAFNGDISSWNVSKVTYMANMFGSASAFNQNIGNWNVGNVTAMNSMFAGASAFNQNISSWDVTKVTNMNQMFLSATAFNQNIGSWNVSNVTNMSGMLAGVTLSILNYDALLYGWSARTLKTAVPFSGGNSKYSSCAAAARAILTGTYGWSVTDGGSNLGVPVLITDSIVDVTVFTANGNGNIYCLGASNPTAYGFCWNTTGSPTIADSKVNSGATSTTGAFTAAITGLSQTTKYYVRAYATNESGTGYGEQLSFTTPVAAPMVLTFNTAAPGSTDNTVTLPLRGTANVTVDWGDGTTTENFTTSGDKFHTYSTAGTYTVSISGSLTAYGFGTNISSNTAKLISMTSFGDLGLTSLSGAFVHTPNLSSLPATLPNTVVDLSYMLYNSKFNGDISGWNVSNVTNMIFLFHTASAFNQNIGGWNVSKVTDMRYLFYGASAFNQHLNSWNVSNVTNMNNMFAGASAFNGNVGSWDVSKVTDMNSMFSGASIFNQNVGGWVVSNVTDMYSMFNGAKAFNQHLSGWVVSKVPNMTNMFRNANSFNGDISTWDVSSVTSMNSMFSEAHAFNQNISNWDVSKVTNMQNMFQTAKAFDQNISGWNVANVTNMTIMFAGASAFNQNIGSWNVANVTNMAYMFHTASKFNQNIGSWNVSKVSDMRYMFYQASAFNQHLDSWNVGNVTNMGYMFNDASAFNGNIESWDVSKVTDMNSMFSGASVFNQNIGSWVVSNVTEMNSMFNGAKAFNQHLSGWVVSKVPNMTNMFRNANSFNGDISTWDVSSVTSMNWMFCEAHAFNQNISTWDVSKVTNMQFMFQTAKAFDQNISGWNVANVTNMTTMFAGASAFNQNIGSWNVANVTNMSYMFHTASKFNQNIGNWDVSKVTGMEQMFYGATTFNQNIGSWDVSSVAYMAGTFIGVTLSTPNYDALLNGWSARTLKTAVQFHGGNSKYSSCAAAARAILTGTYGWTVTDGGSHLGVPVLITDSIVDITVSTANGNGNIYCLGATNPSAYGFCWNTTGSPTIVDSKLNSGATSTTGAFTAAITELSPSTKYYVRAYATNESGTGYGEQLSFITPVVLSWVGSISSDWDTQDNWSPAQVPTSSDMAVIDAGSTNFPIVGDNSSCNKLIINSGSVTVPPAKMLTVTGSIVNNVGVDGLIVKADENGLLPNGTVTFQNAQNNPVSATVEMYSKSTTDLSNVAGSKFNWQHVGIPIRSTLVSPTFDDVFVREYQESGATLAQQWTMKYSDDLLSPFKGYELAPNSNQLAGKKYTFKGELINNTFKSGLLNYTSGALNKGYNLLANSYTAAIDIKSIDFGADMLQTVYMYSTGSFNSWTQWNSAEPKDTTNANTAGQYVAVPKLLSGLGGLPATIPSMQAFVVRATGNVSDSIGIPYVTSVVKNTELQRARKADAEPTVFSKIMVVGDSKKGDCMWIFSKADCTRGFDNGYDGEKVVGSALAPQIFAAETSGNYQVDAVSDIHNTEIGFKPGTDTNYTLTFTHNNVDTRYSVLYLVDMQNNVTTDITANGSSYKFSISDYSSVSRFLIMTGTTDITTPSDKSKLNVFSTGNEIFVCNLSDDSGWVELYNIAGQCIQKFPFAAHSTTSKSTHLVRGTYVAKAITKQNQQIVEKVIISN